MQSLITCPEPNKSLWFWSPDGQFSVKSAHNMLSHSGKITSLVANIWQVKVKSSLWIFHLLFLRDKLLTQQVMQKRKFFVHQGCVLCSNFPSESALHLFFLYPASIQLWMSISAKLGMQILKLNDTIMSVYHASTPTNCTRKAFKK
jgi:zinc-binding in reverse transcriptase